MWRLALSDQSFPGLSAEAIFERAQRLGISRLLLRDEHLRPIRRFWTRLLGERGKADWRGVSQRAEVLDYGRRRLHALRFERLRTGVRLAGWAIAPRPPDSADSLSVRRYALTAAAAAAFLGSPGLLLEGMERWTPDDSIAFVRDLLPALTGLRLILWVRLSKSSPLLRQLCSEFEGGARPRIALDLEDTLPEDFPALWTAIAPDTSMVLFRCEPDAMAWWDQEGNPTLRRSGFTGELVVTLPQAGTAEAWAHWARAHGLWP